MKKRITTTLLLLGASILVGHSAPGGELRPEFEKQLGESVPVKEWGYKVKDLRFTENKQDALVIFEVPGQTNTVSQMRLHRDEFARYSGSIAPVQEKTGADARTCEIWVTFPRYKGLDPAQEREFRRQIGETAPVRDWGFKIQDLRFSEDNHKALVVWAPTGKANSPKEMILEQDEFRRYEGKAFELDLHLILREYSNRTGTASDRNSLMQTFKPNQGASITVTLPDP